MFLKPFRIKSQTSIKGSDRKKLRTEVSKIFPNASVDNLHEVVPAKEEMTIMKIYSHSGESVLVYCLLKNPIFFEIDKVIFPTVYTLWKLPYIMTVFATWPPVFSKLNAGADLMLPGVIVPGEVTLYTFASINKGHPCSVKLFGNKAPIAVGKTAMSGSDMYESGMRGKGVLILHTYKDLLWAHGDKQEVPLIDDSEWMKTLKQENEGDDDQGDDRIQEANSPCDGNESEKTYIASGSLLGGKNVDSRNKLEQISDISQNIANMNMSDSANLVDQNNAITNTESTNKEDFTEAECLEDVEHLEDDDGLTLQERMDNLLYHCFLCAIKSSIKKSDLPLLTSAFYKTHLLPFCPEGQSIDVKKSSHKKLGKFLHLMQQRGFIKVKELSKGADSITEVDKNHLDLRGFIVPEMPARPKTPPAATDYQPPEITELFTITAAVLTFFKALNTTYTKGAALTVGEIRRCVTDYVKANELQEKSHVKLDAVLSSIVLQKSEYKETLRWDELLTRFFNKMSPAYQFTVAGQEPVIKKGKLEAVTLKVVTRSGNKKATLIHNLELFGIDLQEFAHTVQKGVACSTSISQLPGKNAGMEVLVQGNQINFIAQLLFDKYNLPKKFLNGLDLAPKSGKKKR